MAKKLQAEARQFVVFGNYLYVILSDGTIWKFDGKEEWELIAHGPIELLEKTIKEVCNG